ncbi:hypothetical protein Pelo_1445 [Pelomyxa schiedti]|nr:hypothetical protein Pelo_1445 [Pelomyxa schiedti]
MTEGPAEIRRVMTLSRVVWDFVIVPTILDPAVSRCDYMTFEGCCWLAGVADALFPLVPRACRALMGATLTNCNDSGVGEYTYLVTSRYVPLECAAIVGSTRCIEWILAHTRTRNPRKESIEVLESLCIGGKLVMAQEFVDSGDIPWRGGSLRWPVHDADMLDSLREMSEFSTTSLLYDACRGGNLAVVKWVMTRFVGLGAEPWELVGPFENALRQGNIEVAQWMESSTGVVNSCKPHIVIPNRPCAASVFLDVVKLCMRVFKLNRCDIEECGPEIMAKFIQHCSNEQSGHEFQAGCAWIKENFGMKKFRKIRWIKGSRGLKWIVTNFPVKPTQELLSHACKSTDLELVDWLFAKLRFGEVTPKTIKSACANEKDNVEIVKSLLAKVPRPTPDFERSLLEKSLSRNNTAIGEWLDNTFHVMAAVNSVPSDTESLFSKLCAKNQGGMGGIQWFLSRATMRNISGKTVLSAVEESPCITLTLFLMKQFNVSIAHKPSIIRKLLEDGDVSQAKQLVTSAELFSSSEVQEAFSESYQVQSGKVVKWVLQQFHLSEDQVKVNDNQLLANLIHSNKVGCTEWFIHTFQVRVDELVRMAERTKCHGITLSMWKMLMRVLPEMTASIVRSHFMKWAVTTPLHTTVTMRTLGITKADVDSYKQDSHDDESDESDEGDDSDDSDYSDTDEDSSAEDSDE